MRDSYPPSGFRWFGLLAAVLLVAIFVGYPLVLLPVLNRCEYSNWDSGNIDRSIATGNLVAAAVEKYRAANAKFPAKLSDLVPDYLSNVPDPVAGDGRWHYGAF